MLGEFFAARSAELDDALLDDGPAGRYPTVEAKTVDPVSISTLGEILGIGSYDDVIDEVSEGPEAESGEAGVFTVPTNMRDALAAADLDSVTVAARWRATEELAAWPAEDVQTVVRELAALAQRAVSESRELFFWWSLWPFPHAGIARYTNQEGRAALGGSMPALSSPRACRRSVVGGRGRAA